MAKLLLIGASGWIGGHIAETLLAQHHEVRCLARSPEKVRKLAQKGCEIVRGDIADPTSLHRAVESVDAVFVAIHTMSPQQGAKSGERVMSVERNGLENLVTACEASGTSRIIYVTSLGTSPNASSEWLRERWKAEQFLIGSSLDATIIRPGMIVGAGGRGFDTLVGQAKKPVAIFLGGSQKMRTIAIDDLIHYIVGSLDEPRTFNMAFDAGNDDVMTNSQMIDAAAEVVGRSHPTKIKLPVGMLKLIAPIAERAGKLPKGSFRGFLDSLDADATGNPRAIREILPRKLMTFRQAVKSAWHFD